MLLTHPIYKKMQALTVFRMHTEKETLNLQHIISGHFWLSRIINEISYDYSLFVDNTMYFSEEHAASILKVEEWAEQRKRGTRCREWRTRTGVLCKLMVSHLRPGILHWCLAFNYYSNCDLIPLTNRFMVRS